jgi:hypothetical protein
VFCFVDLDKVSIDNGGSEVSLNNAVTTRSPLIFKSSEGIFLTLPKGEEDATLLIVTQ